MRKYWLVTIMVLLFTLIISIPLYADTMAPPGQGQERDNPMKAQLDTLVASGVITQEQADAVAAAIAPDQDQSRPPEMKPENDPAASNDKPPGNKKPSGDKNDFSEQMKNKLDSLVSAGTITQAQETAILEALQPPADAGKPDASQPGSQSSSPAAGKSAHRIVLTAGSSRMQVNGVTQDIDPGYNTVPVIKDGTAFVPIRAIVEALGGKIDWNAAEQKATLTVNNTTVVLTIGSLTAAVNNNPKELNNAPFISSTGRTMLPLRFIAENLGFTVNWDQASQTITID